MIPNIRGIYSLLHGYIIKLELFLLNFGTIKIELKGLIKEFFLNF